jgi:hypothetical protein
MNMNPNPREDRCDLSQRALVENVMLPVHCYQRSSLRVR